MHPQDWESLFIVVLSHGEFLSSRKVNKFWFTQFVRSTLGLDEFSAHKTGITPLFLELLWRRRKEDTASSGDGCDEDDNKHASSHHSITSPIKNEDDEQTQQCSFEEFVRMMEKLSVRCHQSLRASELLHRFNERAAITSTAPQSMSVDAALSHMTRYYFAKACEQSFVSRDSVVMMDPTKSTVSYVGRLVLSHLFASLMDTVVLPVFLRFGSYGRMSMVQYTAFVAYVFQGRKAPSESHVRAVFCQVNRNEDLVGTLAASEFAAAQPPKRAALAAGSPLDDKGKTQHVKASPATNHVPTLELVEFVDALCLLGVVMFSNEVTYKHLRTVEGKVWAFMEQLCQIEGVPMCPSALSGEGLLRLEPRLSLVYPPVLPVQTATSFVVSGLCLDQVVRMPLHDPHGSDVAPLSSPTMLPAETKPLPLSARTSIDTKHSQGGQHNSHNRVARTSTQQRMLFTPSSKELPVNAAVMLQSRTRNNAVSQWSSALFTGQFEVATARTVASRAPHKPLHERVGLRVPTMAEMYDDLSSPSGPSPASVERSEEQQGGMRSPGSASTLSIGSRPSTGRNRGTTVPGLLGSGDESPALSHTSINVRDDAAHPPLGHSMSSAALRRELSPQPTMTAGIGPTGTLAASTSPQVYFTVDGHRVEHVDELASQRLKLQLPVEALLPAGQYVAYCTFHYSSSAAMSMNPEDSSASMSTSVVCTLRRERIATVSVHKAESDEKHSCSTPPYNSRPLILKLKLIRQLFTPALQGILEDLFEDGAPSGRMDRAQFSSTIQTLKNCAKVSASITDRAFELFCSVTNSDFKATLAASGDAVAVTWDSEGVSLPGPPRLSFMGFLHAVAHVYLDFESEAAKSTNTAAQRNNSQLNPYRAPNMQHLFEQAFDESKLLLYSKNNAGKPKETQSPDRYRRKLDDLVDSRDHTTYPSWDQRTQAPFDRALKWRAYNKRENEIVADTLRDEFKRQLASEAPAPNFIPNNPMETLLSAAVAAAPLAQQRAPDKDDEATAGDTTDAADQTLELTEAPAPSTTKALAEVLSRTSSRDAQLSFESRSHSMKLEYFEVAMIRTLSNKNRF
ncbi:Hypothetical protein, putative [Bodo saltans]|uniref:Uncharacterized protein n=1 Tax=Bodo saltans TaxID=75058 RepID=A0A0S4JM84_BODSA|nr:Hypothetical protein, putative [Bodo saltans]|eukprot:CUG91307.1 Hypothetical protein, putative [Bodo saltans]